MAFISFSDHFAMYDVTPVENLFLLEFMPNAPGDYVRVYLYGLMQCYHPAVDASVEGIARVLNLKPEQVLDAFRYWQQKGAVMCLSDNPPSYQFVNLRMAMLDDRRAEEDAYPYRQFNNALQSLFGSDRLLHPQEYEKAMEWVEDLKIPTDVVLLLVQNKIETAKQRGRSVKYLFKEIDKDAMRFAEYDIRTVEDAQRYLLSDTKKYQTAKAVLMEYNQRRAPTMAELEMAHKWLDEWGLSTEDVLRAQKETTRSANPSFAYLDGILQNHRSSAGRMDDSISGSQRRMDEVKKLLAALGSTVTPSAKQIEMVDKLIEDGASMEILHKAADYCGMTNRRTLEQVGRIVNRWRELNLSTSEDIERYMARRDEAFQVLEACGLERRPSEADITQLISWREKLPMDVILYGAGCAKGTQLPMKYLERMIKEWLEIGVNTVDEARGARAAHQNGAATPRKTELPAQQYAQRIYSKDDYEQLYTDVSKLPGGEDE